mmetsp:Transcript_16050/g.28035  ORF Transcript_16050/g.28035 Transcript_16050/m.28035 type:complete len:635 (+) Transcript_16050:313-2217(+)
MIQRWNSILRLPALAALFLAVVLATTFVDFATAQFEDAIASVNARRCGCASCIDDVWNRIDGWGFYTCGARIEFLVARGVPAENACIQVANEEFPEECGPCDPLTCNEPEEIEEPDIEMPDLGPTPEPEPQLQPTDSPTERPTERPTPSPTASPTDPPVEPEPEWQPPQLPQEPDITDDCDGPRTRRSWRSMSQRDRDAFISAVERLKGSGRYDDFVWTHITQNEASHMVPEFLPWHRWFLYVFETELRQVSGDCGLTVPFWDWELDDERILRDRQFTIFDEDQAFGIFTERHGGSCAWDVMDEDGRWDGCLDREYNDNWDFWRESQVISQIVDYDEFSRGDFITRGDNVEAIDPDRERIRGYALNLEVGPHAAPHLIVGGQMEDMSSPNDPLFWVHHSNVDRMYAMWQDFHMHSSHFEWSHPEDVRGDMYDGPNLDRPMRYMSGLAVDFTVPGTGRFPTPREVLSNSGEVVRVRYEHANGHPIPGHCPHDDWFGGGCSRAGRERRRERERKLRDRQQRKAQENEGKEQEEEEEDLFFLSMEDCQSDEWNTFQRDSDRTRWNRLCEQLSPTATLKERLNIMALEDCKERGNPPNAGAEWLKRTMPEDHKSVLWLDSIAECYPVPEEEEESDGNR